jgi:hypothetical protein
MTDQTSTGPETVMDVRGYSTGPIDAKGAFTSEIDLPLIIKPGELSTLAEVDRPYLVDQPGMRHKYLPLRHDSATGALSTGGRYLFRGYEDATKYRNFLETKVFPDERTTFWNRPFFFNAVRYAWRVTGAYDLGPIATHDLNRFERYSVPDANFEARLPELFPGFFEAARQLDLAHVSLMFQPEHNLVGVLTASPRKSREAGSFERIRLSTDALAVRGSVSEMRLTALGARKIFDRTSLTLAVWLPLSGQAGGAAAIWPNSPPIPAPVVERPPGKVVRTG